MDSLEEIKVCAPTPRTCRVCATIHDPSKPHDKNSLYYMNWFYRRNRRFPTWEDASAHCSPATKAAFAVELEKRGIRPEGAKDNGRQRLDRDRT